MSWLDTVNQWDVAAFRWLNGLHAAWLDPVMETLSSKTAWIPVYVLLLLLIWRKDGWQKTLWLLACVAILITLTDQTASGLLKPWIARFRPCRPEAGLDFPIHLIGGKCGGKYGFASSHAANFFGLTMFLRAYFANRKIGIALILLASIVAYSRIYLGVHYPGDVLAGACIGAVAAWIVASGYQRGLNKWFPRTSKKPAA
ncbi:MAG: phosphatase PAP2 family protein [Bacteroidota bacterium]